MVLPSRRRGPSGPLDFGGDGARLTRTDPFSAASGVGVVVTWDTESYDVGGFVAEDTPPFAGFTIPRDGFYLVGVYFLLGATVDEQLIASVFDGPLTGTPLLFQDLKGSAIGGEVLGVTTSGIVQATEGAVLTAAIVQEDTDTFARNVVTPSNFWIAAVQNN